MALTVVSMFMLGADDPSSPTTSKASAPVAALPARPVGAPSFLARRPEAGEKGASGSSWWLGPIGVSLVLVGAVAAGWAARRGGLVPPGREPGPEPKVIGRASLTPRQAVYTVRVGDRILLVGTGPNAAPSLLGDWIEPPVAAPEPLVPTIPARPATSTSTPTTGRLLRTLSTSGEAS
jgi:flagellar biogenesis protein FliO